MEKLVAMGNVAGTSKFESAWPLMTFFEIVFSFNNIFHFELEGISHCYTNNKHNNHPSWALDYFYNEGIPKNTDNN